ncbi:MAG: SHD1 domain-containing protein [Thermoguttaceae bacterium]
MIHLVRHFFLLSSFLLFSFLVAVLGLPLFAQENSPDAEQVPPTYDVRTWTDQKDQKMKARFIRVEKGDVILQNEDGTKTLKIALDKFGSADRTYIRKMLQLETDKLKSDKIEKENDLSASGVLISLYEKESVSIPSGFSKMYRSPFTAARSVAYGPFGKTILVWRHNNEAVLWDNQTGRNLKSFQGNTSGAEVVAFSGDGRLNLSGGDGNNALLKDTLTGETIHTLVGHSGIVGPVAIGKDGKVAVSGGSDRVAILWDVETGKILHRLEGHSGRILSVAFHPEGRHVLTGDSDGTTIMWDIRSGKAGRKFENLGGPVNSVSFNQDGAVAMLIAPSTAVLWGTYIPPVSQTNSGGSDSGRTNNPVLGDKNSISLVAPNDAQIRDGLFESVAFSKNNEYFLLVSKMGNVFFGNLKMQEWIRKIERLESGVNRAAFNDDASEFLTISFNDNAIIWDNQTGEQIETMPGFNYCVSPVRMTRDAGCLITSGSWADPTIAIWDTKSGQLLKRLDGHQTAVRRIEITPNGKRLLSVSFELFDHTKHGNRNAGGNSPQNPARHVILWDISTGKPLVNVPDALGWALDPKGTQLITGTRKTLTEKEANVITFWDVLTGKKLNEIEMKNDNMGHDFLFYPDGVRVLAKQGNSAFNWVARSGKDAGKFRNLEYDIWTAQFSKDGKKLLTGMDDGRAILWDLQKESDPKSSIEFGGHGGPILSVAMSADGNYVLTGSTDKTAILWDAKTGKKIKSLTAGEGSIIGVDFTEDGTRAMVASEDGTVTFHAL